MRTMLKIAPVRKSIRVRANQERAFHVFTRDLPKWWPSTHVLVTPPLAGQMFEPKPGGRWYQVGADGAEATVGRILVWEPPRRLVMTWEINGQWQPSTTVASEVEVHFIAEGDETIVQLEHRKFEALGAEGGERMRGDVNRGWPHVLQFFHEAAET